MRSIEFMSGSYRPPAPPQTDSRGSHSRPFRGGRKSPPPVQTATLIEELKEVITDIKETSVGEVVATTLQHAKTRSPLDLSKKDYVVIGAILTVTILAVATLGGVVGPACKQIAMSPTTTTAHNPNLTPGENHKILSFSERFFNWFKPSSS